MEKEEEVSRNKGSCQEGGGRDSQPGLERMVRVGWCLSVLWVMGCGGESSPSQGELVWGPAVSVWEGSEWAGEDLQAARSEWQQLHRPVEAEDVVVQLVVSYVSEGRDFREPAGVDGYVLRVAPLDRKYRAVQASGVVTIGLIVAPGDGKPIRTWRIGPEVLASYWLPSRWLEGYVFRLDWGQAGPGKGDYVLFVQFEYGQAGESRRICQEVTFSETGGNSPQRH